jgi:glutathione S-transferase
MEGSVGNQFLRSVNHISTLLIFDRFVLNLKQLRYKTVYLEFPEIRGVLQQAGASPTSNIDGTPVYSLPTIVDDATGAAICDSFKIAEYLDKHYPETPKAFPPGSEALQAAFYHQFLEMFLVFAPILITKTPSVLNPVSYEYYHRAREEMFGKPFGEIMPGGEELDQLWKKTGEFFDLVDRWYEKSDGPYFMGSIPSFADFVVGSLVLSLKIFDGEEGEDWKRVAAWNNGRWVRLVRDLEMFASTDK